jgi:hypothetical protein
MTEEEWLGGGDLDRMVDHLRGVTSDRKMRLVACACARDLWHLLPGAAREVVEAAESFIEGEIGYQQLFIAHTSALAESRSWSSFGDNRYPTEVACWTVTDSPQTAYERATADYLWAVAEEAGVELEARSRAWNTARESLVRLLRDIFGNPFRPVAVDPRWLTSTVVSLARGIYDERAFDRLPILADALQDAGCDDPDVLGHCRSPGPHVRGCWVVDLVLGRS